MEIYKLNTLKTERGEKSEDLNTPYSTEVEHKSK